MNDDTDDDFDASSQLFFWALEDAKKSSKNARRQKEYRASTRRWEAMMTLLSPLLLLRANSPTTMIKSRRSLLLLRALKRDVMRFENEEKRSNDGDEFKKKCTKKVPLKRRPRVRERIHLRYYYVLVPRIKQKRGVARIRAHIQQFKKIRSTTRGVSFGREERQE